MGLLSNVIYLHDAYVMIPWPKKENSSNRIRILSVDSKGTISKFDIQADTTSASEYSTSRTLPSSVAKLHENLRVKWSIALERARELERLYPDPVQGMVHLLGEIPGDYDSWREIIEEPYG